MKDILLDEHGDLKITRDGDISLTDSVRQAIRIRLRWFLKEWRFGPDLGIPYFEEVLVRSPNKPRICRLFREAILSVDDVVSVPSLTLDINAATRKAVVKYIVVTKKETFEEEVLLSA